MVYPIYTISPGKTRQYEYQKERKAFDSRLSSSQRNDNYISCTYFISATVFRKTRVKGILLSFESAAKSVLHGNRDSMRSQSLCSKVNGTRRACRRKLTKCCLPSLAEKSAYNAWAKTFTTSAWDAFLLWWKRTCAFLTSWTSSQSGMFLRIFRQMITSWRPTDMPPPVNGWRIL